MRKLFFVLSLFFVFNTNAQRLHVDVLGGMSNYIGDLQISKNPLRGAKPAFGIGFSYELTEQLYLRSAFTYTSLAAEDAKISNSRNLSFETNLFEWNMMAEYDFLNVYDYGFSPYVFAGFGVFNFDPYTFDSAGNKYFLKPLGTEGQGLSIYPDRPEYSLWQVAIPFGAGFKYQINEDFRISVEGGFRKLFTDYLDDVSTNYVTDVNELAKQRGSKAVELSYRKGELPGGDPNYDLGGIRGKESNDWYYWGQVRLTFRLGDNTNRMWQRNVRFN